MNTLFSKTFRLKSDRFKPEDVEKVYLKLKPRRPKELWTLRQQAHAAVHKAVKLGILMPVKSCVCIRCGRQAQAYHHVSYEEVDWLNVTPLCHSCHSKVHYEQRDALP